MTTDLDPRDPRHPQYQKELGFAPCRDDNCPREAVHPIHAVIKRKGGRLPRTCPRCLLKLEIDRSADVLTCRCGWSRKRRAETARPTNERRRQHVETVVSKAIVLCEIREGSVLLGVKYRCPPVNYGGCSGFGTRRPHGTRCRVCLGVGTVTWSPTEMFRFLSTPAAERRRVMATITRLTPVGVAIGPVVQLSHDEAIEIAEAA